MFPKSLSKANRIFAIILILVCSFFVSKWITETNTIINERISFEIKTPVGGPFQLFFNTNNEHNKKNSSTIYLKDNESFKNYHFTLFQKSITHIRFDPPAAIEIKSISIGDFFHSKKYAGLELYKMIKPLHDIDSVEFKAGIVKISTNGIDPYLLLIGIKEMNPASFIENFKKTIFQITAFFLVTLVFILLFRQFLYYKTQLFEQTTSVNISKNLFIALKVIIFSWFLFQMLYFALNIKKGVSPDERYHIEVSNFYSKPYVFHLENSDETIRYGSLTTEPHFYYLVMGKLLLLKPSSIIDYQYLRLLNIVLSLFSLYLTFLLSKEITSNKLIQISILLAQSNVLMFVFLSSMVSYDNLINLLAVSSFIFLFRFIRNPNLTYLLLLFSSMAVGALTKVTYLPLILLEMAVLLFYTKKIFLHRLQLLKEIRITKNITIGIIFFIFLGATIYLYGGNFLKYNNIRPGAELVIGKEKALHGYGIYMRNSELLSTAHTRELMPLTEYVPMYFTRTMETIFSVVGHLSFPRGVSELKFYLILLVLSFFISIYHFKKIISEQNLIIMLFLISSYVLIVFYVNYSSYSQMRAFGVALQGRYNFPIISLIAIFGMNTTLFKLSDKAKIPVILILTFFLVYNSFFWFIDKVSTNWFNI